MYFKCRCLNTFSCVVLCVVLSVVSPRASAHPVTFEGGVAVSVISQPGVRLWHANYSLSSSLALGADYLQLGGEEMAQVGLARLSVLLKRWMGRGSQGNLYLLTGGGVGAWGRGEGPLEVAWMAGFQADYETQRVYTALIARTLGGQDPSLERLAYHALYRFGVAPYIARSNEMQAWLVGQVSSHSGMEGPPLLTLLMRVFHRSALWELGVDLEGRPWLQLMAHF